MISDEAVEAAARAIRESVQPTQAAIVGPYVAGEMQARAALEAAAPHMLADALEAAADELDGKRLLTKPFHEYYPEWLRTRASELKTTNPFRSQA